ncbi:hypothetical protein BH10PLA2_BH10PLA2_11440 [soil metagenome]
MRRTTASWLLAALTGITVLFPTSAQAQERHKIRINTIRVGFPSAMVDSQFKAGNWTPVYVDVQAGPDPVARAKLTIEAVDTDDVRNNYTVDVPLLEPNASETVLAYTKPGSAGDEISAVIRIDGTMVASKSDMFAAIPLDHHLYLTLGGRIPGLKRAITGQAPKNEDQTAYGGPEHVTSIETDIRQFPTRWFGYEGVDLLCFTTSDRDFLTSFLNEREGRKEALAEWVRRGGHIIVSVGRNQDMVGQIEILQNMLPVTVKGLQQLPLLRGPARWTDARFGAIENAPPKDKPKGPRQPVEIATLVPKPGRDIDKLLSEQDSNQLLVVRGAYGMGKVTVVGFDIDRPAFTSWSEKAQNEFWKKLIQETAPIVRADNRNANQFGGMNVSQDNADVGSALMENIEHFSDMPVISFGWVALFILIYILIVGPLDYFFLKKVVKRLELTWITFPTVVITISVVAYFTAYWLKGNDQRINKIDVLSVDLHTQQVYGTSWFSIFSPRIQNYIVGLKPADALGGTNPANPGSVTLSWMGRPEAGWGGTGRARSQGGLFRRAYDYAPEATGLIRVPIQVWATKNFVASWDVPFDTTKPIVTADLKHPRGNAEALTGSITSNFPVPLEGVAIYQVRGGTGKWYTMDNLLPGVPQRLDNVLANSSEEMNDWLGRSGATPGAGTPKRGAPRGTDTEPLIKSLMFHQVDRSKRPNNLLRNMDESWRLNHKDEVILFARISRADGESEQLTASPASQTALWLGELPTAGATRPPMLGSMSQSTYVRIFVPVLPTE